ATSARTRRGLTASASKTGGVVEEDPGQVELFLQVLRECFDTHRLGGVVTREQHVEPQLLSVEVRPVRTLAREERVERRSGRFANRGRAGARDDPHTPNLVGPESHHARSRSQGLRDTSSEVLSRRVHLSPHADCLPLVHPELAPHRDPELTRQYRRVAYVRVTIEGKM